MTARTFLLIGLVGFPLACGGGASSPPDASDAASGRGGNGPDAAGAAGRGGATGAAGRGGATGAAGVAGSVGGGGAAGTAAVGGTGGTAGAGGGGTAGTGGGGTTGAVGGGGGTAGAAGTGAAAGLGGRGGAAGVGGTAGTGAGGTAATGGSGTDASSDGVDAGFQCTGDTDCGDGKACNGVETCDLSTHTCRPGTALVCNDGNACTSDSCDDGIGCKTALIDADGDGYASVALGACGNDCNDGNSAIHPGATEIAGDEIDQNCDGMEICFADGDDDGYRSPAGTVVTSANVSCSEPGEARTATPATDCNDASAAVHPGAVESCTNGVDENCDLMIDNCSVACDWSGARYLSHGWDGANFSSTGAWFSCTSGKLSYVEFVNGAGTGTNPAPSGTADLIVGCNWSGNRWGSQGQDGSAAFTQGATVACDGTRVTAMAWGGNTVTMMPAKAGDLGCNWTGAIFISYGLDGACSFATGFAITCNNGRITHFQWQETVSCPRA